MDPSLKPISNYRQYSPQVQQKSLQSLKIVAPICLVLSIASIICGFMWYSFNGLTEFLLIGLNNICILLTCALSIYWSCTFQIIIDGVYQHEGFPISNIPYLHALFTQITCAIECGIVLSLIEYNSYNQFLLILPLQIIEIFVLLYMANVSRQFNIRDYGVQRFIVYGTSCANLIFLVLAAFNLKQVIQQTNYQMLTISDTNIEIQLMKIIVLVILVSTIVVSLFNLRRIKIYFVTIGFFIISICIFASCINGMLVRQVQKLELELSTTQGCRYAMQTISENSLKEQLNCPNKYLELELSPYLPCLQSEQTYQWETNTNNRLGCINQTCCPNVKKYVFAPINSLTIWINLIIMVGLVQAFNATMLSEGTFKKMKLHIVGDGVMFIILLILAILVVVAYNFTPSLSVSVQHALVKQNAVLNQITILPEPVYKGFDKQEKLVGFYNLQSCQLLKSVILQQLNFKAPNNEKGYLSSQIRIIIAIQGTFGQFTILKDYNSDDLEIMIDNSLSKQLFREPGVAYDVILIKGSVEEAKNLYDNNLYYCSDNPLSADFEQITQFYDIPINRLLAGVSQDLEKQVDQALQFYDVDVTVQDTDNFDPIQDAEVEIYEGRFLIQSCQVIRQLDRYLYQVYTDADGTVKFHNLSQGSAYTILINKSGYKNTCSILDLSRQTPKTKYTARLTKGIQSHSVRVILEWTSSSLNLDLYGQFKVGEHACLTGSLSKSCGGMKFKKITQGDQNIEIIDLNQLEPQLYTIFVKRFLNREQALELLTKQAINQAWIDSDPHITVYINELKYPLIDFRLPIIPNSLMDKLDLTWMVFQIDGIQSDAPISLQRMKNEISNDEIRTNTASSKPFWPAL